MPKPRYSILTSDDVRNILEQIENKTPYKKISQEFNISERTIRRIASGRSWAKIYKNFYSSQPKKGVSITVNNTFDILDEAIAVKNQFLLSYSKPIYWGWYENYDGIHSIAGDGYILWESVDLVNYAINLSKSGIKESPIICHLAEELPTFDLHDIFSHPIDKRVLPVNKRGTAVELSNGAFINEKYATLSKNKKLPIYSVKGNRNIVYLIKQVRNNDFSEKTILAAIATMEE